MPKVLEILATLRDIPETSRDELAAALVAGSGVTITPNDGADTITIAASVVDGSVTLAKMAALAANSVIGNNTGSPATPVALTQAQATALLNAFTGDSGSGGVKGLVPAPSSGDAAANKVLGANGQWVAGSQSGLVLVSASTVSGASAITLTSGITSSYAAYLVVGTVKVSSAAQLRLRTSTNGGATYDSGASDYSYGLSVLSTVPGAANLGGSGVDHMKITTTSGIGSGTTDSGSFTLVLYKPSDTAAYTLMQWSSYCNIGTTGYQGTGSGQRNAAADVDALQFYPDAGTISGTVWVYGMRNS